MQIGFKTGPKTWDEGRRIVENQGATFAEIWFNVLRADDYQEPLAWFQKRGVALGLHHWGSIDEYKLNFTTDNADIRERSLKQLRSAIDLGAKYNAVYVNIHPSARTLERLDVETTTQAPVEGSAVTDDHYRDMLVTSATSLHEYAAKQGVLITFETLPGAEQFDIGDRANEYMPGNPTLDDMRALAAAGCYIANDITHTAGATVLTHRAGDMRGHMWRELMAFTSDVAPQTRLLHANTVLKPFTGSDSHTGLEDSDFAADAFPTREQVRAWLEPFQNRDDVFAIPEPHSRMEENYVALKGLTYS